MPSSGFPHCSGVSDHALEQHEPTGFRRRLAPGVTRPQRQPEGHGAGRLVVRELEDDAVSRVPHHGARPDRDAPVPHGTDHGHAAHRGPFPSAPPEQQCSG